MKKKNRPCLFFALISKKQDNIDRKNEKNY